MVRKLLLSAALLACTSFAAQADIIEGNWKTQSGETAAIGSCGGAFCITLKTGKHAGRMIGNMSGSGGTYNGTITDPADDKKYSGSFRVSGKRAKLTGCALKIFCKTQTWNKM
jgi:uncharacterized protein (DUF2147 family)